MIIHTIHIDQVRGMDLRWMEQAMPARWERAQRFVRERDRLLCLGAGVLLRMKAGVGSERELTFNEHGKPFAAGRNWFSLSHSGDLSAIVIDRGRVGMDMEYVGSPFPAEAAERIFTKDELSHIGNALQEEGEPIGRLQDRAMYRLWTMKESMLKAIGVGLAMDPSSFSVLPALSGDPVTVGDDKWYIAGGESGGYCYSVCREEPTEQPEAENIFRV